MTQEQRYIKMTETPISRLIPSLAVPTIISMLVTSIYNMADTFFVSQISTSASAAVGVSYSLMAMIQALGFTLGMGSGNYLSRVLGSRDTEKAERIASTGFYSAIFVGLLFALICLPNLDRVVRLLGATDTIAPYAKDYARYILIAAPVMTGALSMNNLLRFQGLAVYSMIGITTGGILNMILDPIFIFGLDLGISARRWQQRFKPVHQLRDPVFPELIKKRLCPFKAGKDHTLPFPLRRDPPRRNPIPLPSGRCKYCHCGIKPCGKPLRGRGNRGTFDREPLHDVYRLRHDRIRAGLPAGVRIQLRSEAV